MKRIGRPPVPARERILSRITKTGPTHPIHGRCWYLKTVRRSGQSLRNYSRWVYETLVGPIPRELFVCHKCDHRPCVRLSHLFLGTPDDNSKDMVAKNRQSKVGGLIKQRKGESNGRAKLREADVREIRLGSKGIARDNVLTYFSNKFNVSKQIVYRIIKNETWKHVQ